MYRGKTKNLRKDAKSDGITLIALVVTIIVLLILAGVSISMLTGNNGILNQAQKANSETAHATVYEELLLEITNYWGLKTTGETSKDLLNYLKSKEILDDDLVINVKKLTGQNLGLGNGNITDGDYYILEETTEIGNVSNKLTKIASTGKVKNATNSNNESKYNVVYYGKNKKQEWTKGTISLSKGKTNLGTFADVAKVGDYVNYSKTYTNVEPIKEGLGNGWRVAYVDKGTGVVTLVSEGLPFSAKMSESYNSNGGSLEFNSNNLTDLFDNEVSTGVELLNLEDVQLICEQASIELVYNPGKSDSLDAGYEIGDDELNIIKLDQYYVLNTLGSDQYGSAAYFLFVKYYGWWSPGSDAFSSSFSGTTYTEGVRTTVALKANLPYYGGNGTTENPYDIYSY